MCDSGSLGMGKIDLWATASRLLVLNVRHDPSLILVFFTSLVGIDCRKINGKKIPLGNFCQFNFF